jgi:hypothetical protein
VLDETAVGRDAPNCGCAPVTGEGIVEEEDACVEIAAVSRVHSTLTPPSSARSPASKSGSSISLNITRAVLSVTRFVQMAYRMHPKPHMSTGGDAANSSWWPL